MELKSYDKPWLPALNGIFLILFGILAVLNIVGTIKSLAVLFLFLIAIIGVLLIATGIRYKTSAYRLWTIVSGAIHLLFCIFLTTRVDTAKDLSTVREGFMLFLLIWVIYFAVTELIEAAILYTQKNAFAALFFLNALLTLLFGFFLNVVSGNFTVQSVSYLGLVALVFGIANVISGYLLSRIK
jgi:uncharacterized membrane protein HdeD (DUF308 family)